MSRKLNYYKNGAIIKLGDEIMRKIIVFGFAIFSFLLFMYTDVSANSYYNNGVVISDESDPTLITDISNPYESWKNYEPSTQPYKVDDDDYLDADQPRATINLNDFGIQTGTIYYGGFTTLVLVFQLQIQEVNDGYQNFYVFNPSATGNPELVNHVELDIDLTDSFSTYHTFEFYAEIPRTALTSQYIAIGFGAYGWGPDEWLFRNLEVVVGTSSQTRVTSNLLYLGCV